MFASDAPGGSCFPPSLPRATWQQTFQGRAWRSPAHLARLLVDALGVEAALLSFREHWESYFDPDSVCRKLQEHAITQIRIPLSWSMFPPPEKNLVRTWYHMDEMAHT